MLRLILALALVVGCGFDIVMERWQQRSCQQQISNLESHLRDQVHQREAARLRYQHAIIDCCFKSAPSGVQLLELQATAIAAMGGGE
ncbi:MAG: hypothetical protein ACKVX7_01375 [Planctomycetota bacterium]